MITRISRILFLLILVELCLGGGGRFTAVGPVSLRMILFSFAMVMTVPLFIKNKTLPSEIQRLLIGFVFIILLGITVGFIHGNPKHLIFEDVKPLCYFLILPFFFFTIDKTLIPTIIKIIQTTSLIMLGVFIVILVLIDTGVIPFLDFYTATLKSEELFYRGEITLFFKGFLFFGIGAIFYYFSDSRWKKYFVSFLMTGIVLSITRGLLVSLILTFSVYSFTTKIYLKSLIGFGIVLIIVVWGSNLVLSGSRLFDAAYHNKSYNESDPTLLGDKNYSDNGRVTQVKEVWQELSFSSSILGHGFGAGTSSRPVHMEISYLEIFHKQGLVGLTFWGCLAGTIMFLHQKASLTSSANAFFYSSLFIFIESLTNQYINNPIGMSMLLLSLCCLHKLKTRL